MDIVNQLSRWLEQLGIEPSRLLWIGVGLSLVALISAAGWCFEQLRRVVREVDAQGLRLARLERAPRAAPRAPPLPLPNPAVAPAAPGLGRDARAYEPQVTNIAQLVREVGVLAEEAADQAPTCVFTPPQPTRAFSVRTAPPASGTEG